MDSEIIRKLPKLSMSIGILIFMLIIDATWGPFIFNFATSVAGDAGLLIKLMITFTLLFGTFVVPLLIYSDYVSPSPFNLIYGIITMLMGITAVLVLLWVVAPIAELLLTNTIYLVTINILMVLAIIFFGFINPIFAMIQDDRMDKVIIEKVTGEAE